MKQLLVLRPEPGASQTVAAARAIGLDAIGLPLFAIQPLAWMLPDGNFDALMLTSANAVRMAGEGLSAVRRLPAYAVGEATAAAARQASLSIVHVGSGGAAALASDMRALGVRRALHLAGAVHRDITDPGFEIERAIAYRSAPISALPVTPANAIALIHSPDAGCLFARLIPEAMRGTIGIAAISSAAADRVGEGWATVRVAPTPTDAALLAIARELCEDDAKGEGE